ncbi:diguanylate cyclase [Croceicoccus hydrothermalis]|uniref:diguanylate cyclase n=1 Tax=Croceicoccus hydrothermalis TaxID=2867964 RepID=UPI001EFBBCEB|nr:diguanylate cyclase [Croceicoccus hydrothermalis]
MKFMFRMAHRKGLDWRVYLLIGCVVILAALLTGASWSAAASSRERQNAADWQVHTLEVLLRTDDLKVATLSMVRGERGYLLTGDPAFLKPYERGRLETDLGLKGLALLTRDNPEQQARIRELESEMKDLHALLAEIIALEDAGAHDAAVARVRSGDGRIATDTILDDLRRIEQIEHALLADREREADAKAAANELYQYVLSAIGVLLLILAMWSTTLVRRALAAEAQAKQLLKRHASSDEMTGLSNRRAFLAALDRSVARSTDGRKELAFAIFDIDRFKAINDTHGHAAGDAVIAEVARRAVASFRSRDLVGRIGGEEFGVILPAASRGEAMSACARMRAAIEAEPVSVGSIRIFVTVSIGVSQLRKQEDTTSLMARADEALYLAKNGGRNLVRLAA